jgi:hypothetical protein
VHLKYFTFNLAVNVIFLNFSRYTLLLYRVVYYTVFYFQDYLVNIMTMGWTAGFQFLAVARDFSLFHTIHGGSGAHPNSYEMGTGGLFPPRVKLLVHEADHMPSSSAKVMNAGATPQLLKMFSWHGA